MKAKSPKPAAQTSDKQANVSGRKITPPSYGINFVDGQSTANDAPVQGMFESSPAETSSAESGSKNSGTSSPASLPNKTGLPDNLKSGIERLSGYSMDDVKVHYNSEKPARMQALAYAQGTNIHIASGQEKHLPHEAWHVVQQKQGRVNPTIQMKGGVKINDDNRLEKEADEMGTRLMNHSFSNRQSSIRQKNYEIGFSANTSQGSQKSDVTQYVKASQETTAEKIKSALLKRKKIEISVEEAEKYAQRLNKNPVNTKIPVLGRMSALTINNAGIMSIIRWTPPKNAGKMRTSPIFAGENSIVTEGRRPLTGYKSGKKVRIKNADLLKIGKRESLKKVMGGSAAQMSGIANSEWLHKVAHSLGGKETVDNAQAGSHSLNTAMIPFETTVKKLVQSGYEVNYSIDFFSKKHSNGLLFTSLVEVGIQVDGRETKHWTLETNQERIEEFIPAQVYADIEKRAEDFYESIKK